MESIIKKYRTDIGERKDIENALVENDKLLATVEYIAACDYPEVFEGGEDDE